MVVAILGIISTLGLSRFGATSAYHERGFRDSALSIVRYGHKVAIAGGCHIRIQLSVPQVSGNTVTVEGRLQASRWVIGCKPNDHATATTPLYSTSLDTNPPGAGGRRNDVMDLTVPLGTTVTPFDIYFDGYGRPFDTATETPLDTATSIQVGRRTLTIEAETGFAHIEPLTGLES